jgi:ABC-type multidrug transport system ATPase subunit
MRPTAGEVLVLGRPVRGSDGDARLAIGLLSHQSLLYDDLTLLENLTFAARLYGIARPRDRAMDALEQAGLGPRADELPRRLSRGLLQRAAIARALLHRPRVLLLDEPFTALDAASAERLRGELRAAVEGGLGLVLVTHHLAEVWGLASRIAVLVEGRWVWEEHRPTELDVFVARYRGLVGG